MRRSLRQILFFILLAGHLSAAESPTPQPTPQKRGGWFTRMLHSFRPNPVPSYKDQRLRGLLLELKLPQQPVKLAEVRQLEVKVTLSNVFAKRAIALEFPTEQRIEILLKNTSDTVLTSWSDNHAFEPTPGTVLINPGEHIFYSETIATRELTPNKVFIVEVVFPQYPDLKIRQKFLTAP